MSDFEKSLSKSISFRDNLKKESTNFQLGSVEKYFPFFELIDVSKTSIVFVQNLITSEVYYVSERFFNVLGFKKIKKEEIDHVWFRKRFHPDDFIVNLSGIKFMEYLGNIAPDQRKDYKLIHEFRIQNEQENWIRLLIQDFILELDEKGIPWLNMKLCDLSPNQDLSIPGTSICRNIITGESVDFFKEINKEKLENLSDREKEVLGLIANGMKSKEIAEKLFISANTVNNHRRNVLKKLNVTNSSEAVIQAAKFGLI